MKRKPEETRSPMKATQWRKRGFIIPKDSDGAHRACDRKDGREVVDAQTQDRLKDEARNG